MCVLWLSRAAIFFLHLNFRVFSSVFIFFFDALFLIFKRHVACQKVMYHRAHTIVRIPRTDLVLYLFMRFVYYFLSYFNEKLFFHLPLSSVHVNGIIGHGFIRHKE